MTPERWQQVRIFDGAVESVPDRVSLTSANAAGTTKSYKGKWSPYCFRYADRIAAQQSSTGDETGVRLLPPGRRLPAQNDSFGPYVPSACWARAAWGRLSCPATAAGPPRGRAQGDQARHGHRQVIARFEPSGRRWR